MSTQAALKPETTADSDPSQQQSYKGFGSFHSANVQDLIQLPKEEYVAPVIPAFARTLTPGRAATSLTSLPAAKQEQKEEEEEKGGGGGGGTPTAPAFGFGVAARPFFRTSREWTFINHGAFGSALVAGVDIKRGYEDLMEDQPLTFVDRTLLPLLVYTARSVAGFIGATPADMALVPNATFGLNAAIFGIIESHDVVAYLDTEYGSVWRMLLEKCERVGANLNEIPLSRHFHNRELFGDDVALTEYIRKALPAGCTTIVLDHIASNGAFELPIFTHLIPMLRSNGVKNIIIDGAHGPLQCDLDFTRLPKESRPSVYVGNLHKWFSCPKSVGFIWAHEGKMKNRIRSPVVSHGFNSGYFSEFVWNGTTDYGSHLAIPAVVDFWSNTVGADKVRAYCKGLLLEASAMLEKKFDVAPVVRKAPFMALVSLPTFLNNPKNFSSKYIQDTLHTKYQVEVPVKLIEGRLYYRLSVFVYNTMADYERLAAVTESLVREHRNKRNRDDAGESDTLAATSSSINNAALNGASSSSTEAGGDDANGLKTSNGGCAVETSNSGCGVGGLGSGKRQIQFDDSDSGGD